MKKYIAITAGEPAGIGVDICLSLSEKSTQQKLNLPENIKLSLLADKNLLLQRLELLNSLRPAEKLNFDNLANFVEIQHIPLREKTYAPKKLNSNNSAYVLDLLNTACDGCLSGKFSAMVTAPLHKGVINDYLRSKNDLHLFKWHTEYLANRCKIADDDVVMMLAGEQQHSREMLRVALLTTHLPLKNVSAEVSEQNLIHKLSILHRELQTKYKLKSPKIAVCGLNPHAGENGYLGDEEIKIINPTLQKLRQQGLDVRGAFPADTLFTPPNLRGFDAIFAMYHDQGLAPLKYATFGSGINITLGLPVIRTSVDHGTALEIAGENKAHNGSLIAAIKEAVKMVI